MLQSLYSLAAAGSFCWFFASSLWIYPHSLSYMNETVGPLRGPEHLLGSAVDWGQDLRYLKFCLNENSESCPYELLYFGGFSPASVRLDQELLDQDNSLELQNYRLKNAIGKTSGNLSTWLAISANIDKGYSAPCYTGHGKSPTIAELGLREAHRLSSRPCAYSIKMVYIHEQK